MVWIINEATESIGATLDMCELIAKADIDSHITQETSSHTRIQLPQGFKPNSASPEQVLKSKLNLKDETLNYGFVGLQPCWSKNHGHA